MLTAFALQSSASAQTVERFPFFVPGDDASPTITDQSKLLHRPAGKHGFVTAKDGHFYVGNQRLRMWGVNLCFGANFPTHEEADKLAPHLAKLGFNAVRFHHIDNADAPNGIWGGYDEAGKRQFSPEMVDRLDYLLSRLAEVGIYADLNMHVSRELTPREGFPVFKDAPWWATSNKYVMYFDDDVQAEVKRFAKDLLTHTNPYRGLKRVDDPAIALVEMFNEDFFSVQGYADVDKLPVRFQESLKRKWNAWLAKKYVKHDALSKAWQANESKLGAALIPTADWQRDSGGWTFSRDDKTMPRQFGRPFPTDNKVNAIRIAPTQVTEQDYQQQLLRQGISLKQLQPITLSFWARADRARKFRMELSTLGGGGWRELGLMEDLQADTRWQQFVRIIHPKETINGEAFLAFSIGLDKTPIEFAKVELNEGAAPGKIPPNQSLDTSTIGIPDATFPAAAHTDMRQFMVDTERNCVRTFKAYLKELGVRVPMTASQVDYHAPSIVASELDYADAHNYWHHPVWPTGQDWNPVTWTVGNTPMESGPMHNQWPSVSLLKRAKLRIDGLPFTMSEWNYPEPSRFGAGCVPMGAVVASLQDWDGLFFFEYEGFAYDATRPYLKTSTNNFFSFNGAPAKLTAASVFANVFLRGDLTPLQQTTVLSIDQEFDARVALAKRVAMGESTKGSSKSDQTDNNESGSLSTPDKSLQWHVTDPMKKGHLVLQTDKTTGVWGTISNQRYELNVGNWSVDAIKGDYGILIATSMDNEPLRQSKRVVLLAATHTENENMIWNAEHTSVGKRWGGGIAQAVAIPASIELPWSSNRAVVHALDGAGNPTATVPSQLVNGRLRFDISNQYRTMWYSIEVP